jgi:hypothetical protein
MRISGTILAASTALALTFVGMGCSQGEDERPGDEGFTPVDSPPHDANAVLAQITSDLPGFAGYARDPASGVFQVFSTDPNMDPNRAREVLGALPGIQIGDSEVIVIVPVEHDYASLTDWYQTAMDAIFPLPPWVQWVYSDVDESTNTIVFAFADEKSRAWGEDRALAAGVPGAVLRVILADPAKPDEGDD